jgi:hypothetical protein
MRVLNPSHAVLSAEFYRQAVLTIPLRAAPENSVGWLLPPTILDFGVRPPIIIAQEVEVFAAGGLSYG